MPPLYAFALLEEIRPQEQHDPGKADHDGQVDEHGQRRSSDQGRLSLIDELTGLYNRRGFLTLARHQQKICSRTGKEMLLIYADVDDAALAETAKILAAGIFLSRS